MQTDGPAHVRGFRDSILWDIGFSSYWFATSYKWFILLFVIIPSQTAAMSPEGEKNTMWGLVFGIGALWAIIGPTLTGRLNETLPGIWRKRQIWIGLGALITVIGLLVMLQAKSILILGIGYLCLQIGDSVGCGPYAGMVADTVPPGHRDRSSSIMGALKFLGQIVSGIMAFLLSGKVESIYIAIGAINIIGAAFTIWTIRDVPGIPPRKRDDHSLLQDWIEPFRSNDFKFVWLNRFVVAFAFGLVAAYTLNYMTDAFSSFVLFGHAFKNAKEAAQVLAMTISLCGMIGALSSGPLARRSGRKPQLIASGLIVACGLVPIAFTRDFTLIWLMVCVFGVGNGMYAAADWALVSDILPNKDKAATEMGVWHSAETVVQVFIGGIGFFVDLLNRMQKGAWYGYTAMILASAFFFLLSTLAVRRIKGSR